MSFRLVRNLSLFSEGFPTRFACGNDSLEPRTDFEIGSSYPVSYPGFNTGCLFDAATLHERISLRCLIRSPPFTLFNSSLSLFSKKISRAHQRLIHPSAARPSSHFLRPAAFRHLLTEGLALSGSHGSLISRKMSFVKLKLLIALLM
jgi:hypothetical protein